MDFNFSSMLKLLTGDPIGSLVSGMVERDDRLDLRGRGWNFCMVIRQSGSFRDVPVERFGSLTAPMGGMANLAMNEPAMPSLPASEEAHPRMIEAEVVSRSLPAPKMAPQPQMPAITKNRGHSRHRKPRRGGFADLFKVPPGGLLGSRS